MIRMLVALTAGLGVLLAYTTPSEACGIKLTVQSPNVQNQSAKSPNPSRVLLVGSPPRRLARNLSNAGHRVEVAENVDAARRDAYPVVVADQEHVADARERFPGAQVVPRTGSTNQSVARVEQSLQRAPRDASGRRVAVRAGGRDREPIAVGRDQQERSAQAAAGGSQPTRAGREQADPQAETAGDRTPTRAQQEQAQQEREQQQRAQQERERQERARAERERQERERAEREAAERDRVAMRDTSGDSGTERATRDHRPERQHDTGASASIEAAFHEEIFFETNGARLDGDRRRAMRATAAWLAQNPSVSIVIEGHANAVGNPRYNMRLSQRRAETVRDFFVSQGIDASRIEVEWHGQDRPAYGDGTDGRNRRVVLRR
jgi:outer membrane protein OmpA-like peptidoglycan-associated protein